MTQVPVTQAYGIGVDGGQVWFGAGGNLVRVDLQTIGGATDRSVPVANSAAGPPDNRIRIDITLSNSGATTITGDALYMYSPGAFAAKTTFSVGPGATQVLADAFGNIGTSANLAVGSVRLRAATGNAADLQASVRTSRVTPLGAAYGYSLEAPTIPGSLGAGSQSVLFTGARDTEVSIFGMYSMTGATGTLTLAAPDGSVRGTHALHDRDQHARRVQSRGDRLRGRPRARRRHPGVGRRPGSLQPYVNVLDLGTYDVAVFVPVQTLTDAIVPNAGVLVGANSTEYVTDLFLSNPDPGASSVVSVTYYPLYGPSTPLTQAVTLAPLQTQVLQNVLNTLYGLTSGQGSLFVSANLPVAAGVRVGARTNGADYAGFAPVVPGSAGLANASGTAFGLPQTAYRRTNLLFYNRGAGGQRDRDGLPCRRHPGRTGPGFARRPCARPARLRVRRLRRDQPARGPRPNRRAGRNERLRLDRGDRRRDGRRGPRRRRLRTASPAPLGEPVTISGVPLPTTVVRGSGMFVPEGVVTNARLARLMDTTDEWIRQRTGIEERRFARRGQSSSVLGLEAARRALADAGLAADRSRSHRFRDDDARPLLPRKRRDPGAGASA